MAHTHSLTKGTIIEKAIVESRSVVNNELRYMQWQLEWGTVDRDVSLALKCVPDPGLAEKLENMTILIKFSIHSGDLKSNPVASVLMWNSVKLDRESDYRLRLVGGRRRPAYAIDNPVLYSISLHKFTTNIGCDIEIMLMDSHLSECYKIDDTSFLYPNKIGGELLASLNKTHTFSDVTLIATPTEDSSNKAPVEFSAHKAILAARSPVFAKMFEHKMQESQNNRVELIDIGPDVVRELLVYLYTDRVPKIEEMVSNLLYVADKYQLDHLKSLCERHLTYRLQIDNAASVIQLAFMHNAPQLKKNARFISKCVAEVRATEKWAEAKQCPEILDELIEMMQEPPAKRPKTD